MLTLKTTTQFRKDYKLAKKRGYNLDLLNQVLNLLLNEEPLETKHHDHALTENYTGFRECHIQPDWLLIYMVNDTELILTAAQLSVH